MHKLIFFFKTILKNLNKNGLLIFDYWLKSSVLSDPPKEKIKKIKYKNISINRTTKFRHLKKKDLIKINFNFLIKKNNKFVSFNETHDMRYFSKKKVNNFLKLYNFKLIKHSLWLNKKTKNWYICTVAQKI